MQLIGEYDASGTMLRRYVTGPMVDEQLVWMEGSGTTDRRWLLGDQLGTVVTVTNGSGSVIQVNAYDEYGIPSGSNLGRMQYTGQTWLPVFGLYNYRARIYSPSYGRFYQPDPLGYTESPNLYQYVIGDPINLKDPSGLQSVVSPVGVTGGRISTIGALPGWAATALAGMQSSPALVIATIGADVSPVIVEPPDKPPNIEEKGPWERRPGSARKPFFWLGPKQPKGPRLSLWWVPEGGPQNSIGYWEYFDEDGKKHRFDRFGKPVTAQEAHPGRPPGVPVPRGPAILWLPIYNTFLCQFALPGGEIERSCREAPT